MHNIVNVEARVDLKRLSTEKTEEFTSIANNIPPIGAPNVLVIPTATAAVKN